MRIVFISQNKAESIIPKFNQAIISITEPGYTALLKDGWLNMMRLAFHDADSQVDSSSGNEKYTLFSEFEAKQIIDFYESLPDYIDELIIHCHAGISRSAGVAKALCDRYNIENTYKNYTLHNKLVYEEIFNYGKEKYENS